MTTVNLAQADRPRVLLVTGGLDCGGAQRVLSDMANYWADRGWHIELATWSGPHLADFYALRPSIRRTWLAVDAGRTPVGRLFAAVARIYKFRRLLREHSPDAVLSFIDVSNVLTILAALGLGVRVVIAERTHPGINDTVPVVWRAARRICYRWAAHVVAQTRAAADWIERACRVRVVVIPNPLRPLPHASSERQPLILGIGRLSHEKGFDLLLEAFARVSPSFAQWQLRILGDGPERSRLIALRDRLGLQGQAELVGLVSDVEAWLARAAIVVQPSRREGFPNALLEAMGMGVAVIGTDCLAGPAELIEDGVNGYLVSVDDVDKLSRRLAGLMASPALRAQLGHEAARVRERYASDAIMGEWEACLLPQSTRHAHSGRGGSVFPPAERAP